MRYFELAARATQSSMAGLRICRPVVLAFLLGLASTAGLAASPRIGSRGGGATARSVGRSVGRSGGRGRGGRGRGHSTVSRGREADNNAFWEEEDSLLLEADRRRRRKTLRLDDGEAAAAPAQRRNAAATQERAPGAPRAEPKGKVWNSEVGGNNGRGANAASFFSPRSFAEVGASDEMREALRSCGAAHPSHVQAAGYEPILAGRDVILADQTGSGKTLGYLAPIVQRLRAVEAAEGRTPAGQVRAVVLAPTAELAQQVTRVLKALCRGGVPLRSAVVTGEHPWTTQRKALAGGVDVVVATPGRLRSHVENSSIALGGLVHLALDEADVLYEDAEFAEAWDELRAQLPQRAAVAFVTATLTPESQKRIEAQFPLVERRTGRGLHRTVSGVHEKLIDCSGAKPGGGGGGAGGGGGSSSGGAGALSGADAGFERKMAALLQELQEAPVAHALLFCNTIESCRRVENALRRADRRGAAYRMWAYHGAISAEARKRAIAAFVAPDADADAGAAPLPRLLVCTDRASRGMDFPQVGHVVLFDFPRDGVEYVRRVGRATRGAGEPGRVTSLLLGRQVAYARALMKLNSAGEQIDLETHG